MEYIILNIKLNMEAKRSLMYKNIILKYQLNSNSFYLK